MAECKPYEKRIKDYGRVELFFGGIGEDGQIAFNVISSISPYDQEESSLRSLFMNQVL